MQPEAALTLNGVEVWGDEWGERRSTTIQAAVRFEIELVPASHVRFAMLSCDPMTTTPSRDDDMVSKNPDELLTVGEVSAELKVTEATVRRWINQDKLPARRLGGGEFRVLRRDLDAFQGITPEPPRQQRSTRPFTATAERMNVR